jgi:hypothetical protein
LFSLAEKAGIIPNDQCFKSIIYLYALKKDSYNALVWYEKIKQLDPKVPYHVDFAYINALIYSDQVYVLF